MDAQPYIQMSGLNLAKLCLWREDRGGSMLARRGVACVLKFRADHPRHMWGLDLKGVVLAPKQFSSFNSGDPNETRWPADYDRSWVECCQVIDDVFGCVPGTPGVGDITSGASNYHDVSVTPKWATDGSHIFTIALGRLRFYKEITPRWDPQPA